jgi:hypothetical protein
MAVALMDGVFLRHLLIPMGAGLTTLGICEYLVRRRVELFIEQAAARHGLRPETVAAAMTDLAD